MNCDELVYTEIAINDIGPLAELFAASFNAPPWNESWTSETATKRIFQMMSGSDSYGLVAYRDNTLCGMILGSPEQYCDNVVFQVKEFCVRNQERGQGTGARIFEELEKRLMEKGVDEITLLTVRGPHTEGFYEKRGMSVCEDMVLMSKSINAMCCK